jgi:hypothetical protein
MILFAGFIATVPAQWLCGPGGEERAHCNSLVSSLHRSMLFAGRQLLGKPVATWQPQDHCTLESWRCDWPWLQVPVDLIRNFSIIAHINSGEGCTNNDCGRGCRCP